MSFGRSPLAVILGTALGVASASPVKAQTAATMTTQNRGSRAGRFSLLFSGAFAATTSDFDGARRFTEFAEEGQIQARYSGGRGPGFDAGLRFALKEHWALSATFAVLKRSESASYTARVPHPLYLNRHREVNASLGDLHFSDTDGHLALAYLGHAGGLDLSLFAGPSLFHVTSDLITQLQYSQEYPYDSLQVTSVPTASAGKTAFGFNVGGGLERRLGGHLAVGGQVRYSLGSAKLENGGQDTVTVNAGGLEVLVGLRVGL
jgi:opacity protein-like surface antigen